MSGKTIHNSAHRLAPNTEDTLGLGPNAALRIDLNTNLSNKKQLTVEEQLEIRKRQAEQAAQAIPLHILFLLCSAVTITTLAGPNLAPLEKAFWHICCFIPAVVYGFAYYFSRYDSTRHELIIRLLEFGGLVEGLVWTIPMGLFLADASNSNQTIIIGVSLAVAGVGALALARIPTGAILLSSLMVAAASNAVYTYIDKTSLAPSILCGIYGIVLIGIVISMHWEFLRGTKAEMEVTRQRQVIALLLNDFEQGTSDWLWETNREGSITYFSPRLVEAIGRPESEILDKTFAQLVEPSEDEGGWMAFTSAMAREQDIPSQLLSLRLNDRIVHWQMTARPLTADGGRFLGYRGVGRDVSEKWDSEVAIREAKEQAEKANVAKSQFLSIVGHEIRTPLNAIVGFAELMMSPQGDSIPPASRREYLQTILESAHQLQALINDVLDTTRIEKGTLRLIEQEADAAEIVEVAAKQCREQADKASVTVVVRLTDNIKILGDQSRLKQVMYNLLSNAIKFSPSGSIVNADCHQGPAGEFLFSVRDAGIGIKAEDVERVFEPFVQADEGMSRRFGGLGLGLSLARKIARLHGGDITLESKANEGTTARLTLPPSRIQWPQSREAAA